MPDYSKGAIYMLEPTVEYEDGDIYYGSTTQPLYKRFYGHKQDFKRNKGCNSRILFEKYGIENINIILIKSFSCENKKELDAEEAKYIRENKCVNSCIPGRCNREYREQNKQKIKDRDKEYYENNKEKVKENVKKYYENNILKRKEYDKEYRQINIEKLKDKDKKYYENNKQKRLEYDKNYREANKEKLKEKIKCECGCEVVKTKLNEHQKTKKHSELLIK